MIYLDNAATTWPKPNSVYNDVMECIKKYCGNPGRGSHLLAMKSAEKIYETRNLLCKLFNGENPLNFIFTSGATESINLVINGLLRKGDHVITTNFEHNSVLRPLKMLEKSNIETTFVNCWHDNDALISSIKSKIKANTRMIICTHASNVTGQILPVKEIGSLARTNRIPFMVDAAQSAGCIPIDIQTMNIDILAGSGHKGLFGLQGVGFIYIPNTLKIKPLKYGGTGSESEKTLQPNIIPDMYESGTLNTPGIVGLCGGLKYLLKNGINEIRSYEQELTSYLIENLSSIRNITIYGPKDAKKSTGVVSINIQGISSSEICNILDTRFNIATRAGLHCAPHIHSSMSTLQSGTTRLSLSCFNNKKQIITCIQALNKISKETV